jgi:hypothetical protein
MAGTIPNPQGMDVLDWADQIVYSFGAIGVPRLNEPDAWREWADRISQLGPFQSAPRQDFFDNWQAWARALIGAIQ